MKLKLGASSLAVATVFACGGQSLQTIPGPADTNTQPTQPSGAGGTAGTPGASPDGTPGDTNGMPGPGGPGGPGTPGAGTPGGGPGGDNDGGVVIEDGGIPTPAPDHRLFPAEDLRTWSYQGFTTSAGFTQRVLYSYTVLGIIPEDGHDTYVITSNFNGQTASNHTWLQGDDDVLQQYGSIDPTWYPVVKGPAVEGGSWTYFYSGQRTQTWHFAGTVSVAAGTFNDCWRIDYSVAGTSQPGDVNYMIMCRGVGNVKVSQRLWNGYVLDYELVSKNF